MKHLNNLLLSTFFFGLGINPIIGQVIDKNKLPNKNPIPSIQIKGIDIAGAPNGVVYRITEAGYLSQSTGDYKVWTSSGSKAGLKKVAVVRNTPYVIGADNQIFKLEGGRFIAIPGRAKNIIGTPNGLLYSISKASWLPAGTTSDENWAVYFYNRSSQKWKLVSNENIMVNKIGAAGENIYYTDFANRIYAITLLGHRNMPGLALSICGNKKELYVVGTSRRLFQWNAKKNNWELFPDTPLNLSEITMAGDQLLYLNTAGQVRVQPSGSFVYGSNTFTIYDGPIGNCSPADKYAFDEISRYKLGVDGSDPRYGRIGLEAKAIKPGFRRNWYPLSEHKQTLCGTLSRFSVHRGEAIELYTQTGNIFLGGVFKGIDHYENDWNAFIIPSRPFQFLIEDARRYATEYRDWHRCDGVPCMEGEVTPVRELYDFPPFSALHGTSTLVNQEVCTYGPWVREEVHGDRPEIHPAELFWWKEGRSHLLLMVQDASNRFDETGDFLDEPDHFKPWAASPMYGSFKIPFRINTKDKTHIYTISIDRGHTVTTSGDPNMARDQAEGNKYTIRVGNHCPIFVEEVADSDERLGVRFESVCYDEANADLRGYIVVSAIVGNRTHDGYVLIRVDERIVLQPTLGNIPPAR